MPRFLTGDELGNIKSVHCSQDLQSSTGWKLEERILFTPSTHAQISLGELDAEKAKASAVQRLSISSISGNTVLAAARANGALSAFPVNSEDGKLEISKEWKDSRFKAGHRYVGLGLSPKGLFWCTSNGAIGFSSTDSDTEDVSSLSSSFQKASLPMRLCAWGLSPDTSSFAYGGDEVDLSVWDTARTFESDAAVSKESQLDYKSSESKKRKRGCELLPGEIWRAKNLPNDSFGLRQPIHITSLSYLPSSGVHLVTGTQTGDVRRYDTRAARKPVANWSGVAKVSGVSVVKAGLSEHELFVADNGTNLSALDLRNGRTIYSYKKLQGAVTSLTPSPCGFLGSTSRDRFFRLHTTFPPPETAGRQQDKRGDVVGTVYMKSAPTAVVFDESSGALGPSERTRGKKDTTDDDEDGLGEDDEKVWADMQDVGDSDEEGERRQKGKRRP